MCSQLANGGMIKLLRVLDEHTWQCLSIELGNLMRVNM